MKCSKLTFEKNAKAIIGSPKGTMFDEDFKKTTREETKDTRREEGDNKSKNRIPGRRF